MPSKQSKRLKSACFYDMITGTNESKTLTKHISCESQSKRDGRKCNSKSKVV